VTETIHGVRRLVETSEGWVELDASRIAVSGLCVTVTAFADDLGWESTQKVWNQRYSEEPFAEVIAEVRGVPADEAERIAAETLDQWRARGGETADRDDGRTVIAYLASTFGLAAVGVLALVALVVWLVVGWL
jgi:hypothetical protein